MSRKRGKPEKVSKLQRLSFVADTFSCDSLTPSDGSKFDFNRNRQSKTSDPFDLSTRLIFRSAKDKDEKTKKAVEAGNKLLDKAVGFLGPLVNKTPPAVEL